MKERIEHKTKEPTAPEKELAAAILANGQGKKPDPKKFAKAKKLTAAALKSPRHELGRYYSVIDGLPIHYFHRMDESVTGVLGPATEEAMGRGVTFPLVLDSGRVIRIPGNKMIHKLVEKTECIGLRVTIVFKGKLYYRYAGRSQNTYEIVAAPLPAEAQPKKEEPIVVSTKSKDDRRDALRYLLGRRRRDTPISAKMVKLLEEFRGEAWADAAIAKAKEGR